MIDFLFLALPTQLSYDNLKDPIVFADHLQPYSCWAFKSPLAIYSKDLKERHVFSEGRVQVENVESPILQQKWKYFVMTKSDNSKVFCTSYIFYEKANLKVINTSFFPLKLQSEADTEFYLPKCLILRSSKPYFKLQTNLIKIHRELRRNNSWIFQQINRQSLRAYENELRSELPKEEFIKKSRTSLISLERTRLNSQSSNTKLLVSLQILFSYYVSASNQIVRGQKKYICSHNKFEILHIYNISDSLFRLNYFFHLPISMQNLFIIISAILQEKQIIFTSSNQNSNLMLMETIVEMLAPLKWQYMYAPNLPQNMLDAAEYCFMPYMVGIHRKFLDKINTSGKIIVHVDNDRIQFDQNIMPLPDLLKKILTIPLISSLSQLSYIEWQCRLRMKSIIFVSTLLSQFPIVQQKQFENSDYNFYSYFFQKSAMYQTFKNQINLQPNIQVSELMWFPLEIKFQIIQSHFRHLINQANFPIICQNESEWIKYYYHKYEKGRRSLKNQTKSSTHLQNSLAFLRSSTSILEQIEEGRHKNYHTGKKGIGFVLSTVKF